MPISLEFTDKSMLVIGGERGIGFAISKDLAEAGADVVISYLRKMPRLPTKLCCQHLWPIRFLPSPRSILALSPQYL
ncbi:hypothetical protein AYX14_05772 [Cryptococcus neoformans]|nr:hypothetical protein AYX15_05204 [Cryptococcus neoformans var. grubii]OWZ67264.1 hypothetical protein AYX14_05772 [Cryptococcus neoformans var. grubii]